MGLAGGCATPCKPLGVSCDFPMYVKVCGNDYEIVTVCDKATGLPLIAVVGVDNETGLPTSLVYNLNGTPFVGTTVSCSYPFEIEYQIVCQNGTTQFTRGDIWKDGVPTGSHFYLNALGSVVATPTGTITVGSCPLPAEIDQESVDWNPICVNGVQWYFADNYNFNNALATRTFQPTLYKQGDNGVVTTTRPTGTFVHGHCASPCEYKLLKRIVGTNGVNLLTYTDAQALQVNYVSGGIQSIFTGTDSSGMPAHPNAPTLSTTQPLFANSLNTAGAQQHSIDAWIYTPVSMKLRDANANHENAYSYWLDGVEKLFEVGITHDLGILPAGIHRIKVYVHDDVAGIASGINLQWSTDGASWSAIPTTNLFIANPTVTCGLVKVCEDGVYINNVLTTLTPTDTWVDSCEADALPIEFDATTIDWNPICVAGVQWYFADVITVNNTDGSYTTTTVYKQGDDGVASTTRPTGTVTGGYCPLTNWSELLCDTFVSPDVTTTYTDYTLSGSVGFNASGLSFSSGNTPVTGVVSELFATVVGETYDFTYTVTKLGTPVASALVQVIADGGTGAVLYTQSTTPATSLVNVVVNGAFTATSTSTLIRITDTTPNTTNVDLRIVGTGINFISQGNVTSVVRFNRVYTLSNGTVTFVDYDLTGQPYTPIGAIGDCQQTPPIELDNSPIDWKPMCVGGVQWYFADVMLTNNVTGLATTTTLYKQGDNGSIGSVRPAGTIKEGYCCLPVPAGETCYTVTETYTLNPLTMLGPIGISGSKLYGDTLATISVEASSLGTSSDATHVFVTTGTSGTPVQNRRINISFSKPVRWQIDFTNIQTFNANINLSERFFGFSVRPDSRTLSVNHQYDVAGNNILAPASASATVTDASTFVYNSNNGISFSAGYGAAAGTQLFGNIRFTTTYQRKALVFIDCNGAVSYKDSVTGATVPSTLIDGCLPAKELDVDSINWQPMCVNGQQWYWADVITIDNNSGLYTTVTQYKQGDNGTVTTTRPFGATQLGYCPSTMQVVRSHNNFTLASGGTVALPSGLLSLVVTKTNGLGVVTISGTNGTNYPLTLNNESFSQGVNEEVSSLNAYTITSIGGATAKISEVR